MPVTSKQYKQHLINTQINYTCDYLGQFDDLSGDSIERFLKTAKLKPSFVWEQIKDEIVYSPNGCLIIDKTVLEHKNSRKIEGAYKQWSGNSHAIVMGIGVVNLVYYNPELDRFWIIDFRIWDKEVDGKKETTLAHDLLKLAVDRNVEFSTVLFDSFYASSKFMIYIALTLKKTFFTNLPRSRNCKETQDEPYKQIKDLVWTEQELISGKILFLREVPKCLPVKLFSITSSDRRVDNLCTNIVDDSMTTDKIQEENSKRWHLEEFHREIKQTTGISKCQCRKRRSQRNHIVSSILSWIYMKKRAIENKITVYQLKKRQLDDYMKQVTKHPYWEYQGV
jgi:hypothetical protein